MRIQTELIGVSGATRRVLEDVDCAAGTDAKVLLTGESGVGKEVVAQLIHRRSNRGSAKMIAINCAGVPDSLLASELFGHVRGSFTDAHRDKQGWLEQAHRGTIFMDEVGEMSLQMQAALLRFLENGEIQRVGADRRSAVVDVRIIAATNRRLIDRVAANEFREDLFYRLNVIHIEIPPLRERPDDMPALVDHFLGVFSETYRINRPKFSKDALEQLMAAPWPGNVRQLRNVLERLVRAFVARRDHRCRPSARSALDDPEVRRTPREIGLSGERGVVQADGAERRDVLDRGLRAVHGARSDAR